MNMNKSLQIIFFVLSLSFFFPTILTAQENDTTQAKFIITQMRLPFPPSKDKKPKYYSLDDEVANTLNEAKKELGLSDVVVAIYIDSTSEIEDDEILDFAVLNFNEVTWFKEALVVMATEIFQEGVPPAEEEEYFSLGEDNQGNKAGDYSKNVQTQLSVYALFINIETGESLGSLDLEVFHTGGSSEKSKAKAMSSLKKKAKAEFKRIYWFSSDVITTDKGKPGIPFGTKSRVGKGLIFELFEPDRIWELDDEEFLVPGSSAAIATVADTSADSSGLRILRQWRYIYPGNWAVEHPAPIFALGLNFSPPSIGSYSNLGISFHFAPLKNFDYGVGIQISTVIDSYEEDDYGFGFGCFGIWRFINTSKIDFGGKLGIDLDIPFKKDDDGQIVHTVLFSSNIGIVGEFLLSRKLDFVINAGYRIGTRTDDWEYSEDEESYPAYWEKDAPAVENSGLILSVGFKYLLF
jgi:hypothetical protein